MFRYRLLLRRGNWITLKLKKLMKSSSREHGTDRPPTPTHPGVAEPHLFYHDKSSFISSTGSVGLPQQASTTAGDAVSPQRISSEYALLEFTCSSPIDLAEQVSSKNQSPLFTALAIEQEEKSSSSSEEGTDTIQECVHVGTSAQSEDREARVTCFSCFIYT